MMTIRGVVYWEVLYQGKEKECLELCARFDGADSSTRKKGKQILLKKGKGPKDPKNHTIFSKKVQLKWVYKGENRREGAV